MTHPRVLITVPHIFIRLSPLGPGFVFWVLLSILAPGYQVSPQYEASCKIQKPWTSTLTRMSDLNLNTHGRSNVCFVFARGLLSECRCCKKSSRLLTWSPNREGKDTHINTVIHDSGESTTAGHPVYNVVVRWQANHCTIWKGAFWDGKTLLPVCLSLGQTESWAWYHYWYLPIEI